MGEEPMNIGKLYVGLKSDIERGIEPQPLNTDSIDSFRLREHLMTQQLEIARLGDTTIEISEENPLFGGEPWKPLTMDMSFDGHATALMPVRRKERLPRKLKKASKRVAFQISCEGEPCKEQEGNVLNVTGMRVSDVIATGRRTKWVNRYIDHVRYYIGIDLGSPVRMVIEQ